MAKGQRVELTGMMAEVVELTDDGRPAEVVFRFDVPLEDRSLLWLCFRAGHFEPWTPTEIGQSISIHIGGPLEWALRADDSS